MLQDIQYSFWEEDIQYSSWITICRNTYLYSLSISRQCNQMDKPKLGSVGNIEWPVKLYSVPWINKGRKIKIHQLLIKFISSNHGQLSLLRVSIFVSIRRTKSHPTWLPWPEILRFPNHAVPSVSLSGILLPRPPTRNGFWNKIDCTGCCFKPASHIIISTCFPQNVKLKQNKCIIISFIYHMIFYYGKKHLRNYYYAESENSLVSS